MRRPQVEMTPPAGGGDSPVGGSAQVVAPPTTAPEQAPRHRGAESPATQSPVTQNPVTENQPEGDHPGHNDDPGDAAAQEAARQRRVAGFSP